MNRKPDWTEQELAMLKEYYPLSTKDEIAALLFMRTYKSIKQKAGVLKIKKVLLKNKPKKIAPEDKDKRKLISGTLHIKGNVMIHRME